MSTGRQVLFSAATIVLSAGLFSQAGNAQSIVNAHSGTIGYFEGDVSIDGFKLVSQVARFSEMKEQSVLKTDLGRAEVMLTPGVLLRVGEHSSVKMLDNRLMSTRVEFLSGTAMLESMDSGATVKDPAITIVYGDFSVQPVRNGIFEISSTPGEIRVFKGEAKLFGNGNSTSVKDGNKVELTSAMASSKFDAKEADDLYLWSRDRSAYLSAGNMASARQMSANGYAGGFSNSSFGVPGWNSAAWRGFSGGWYYNQNLGMYSYIPFGGTVYSPFGYGLYNPVTIAYIYVPGYYWNGAGGSRTGNTTGVPLSSAPSISTTVNSRNQPQLPRLGITATLRPSLSAPLRGTEIGAPTSSIASRNSLAVFPQNPGFPQSSASNNISTVAPVSAPVAAAPAMAAPVAAAPAAAPVSIHR